MATALAKPAESRTASSVTVVGHPFSTVGMGEQARAGFRALQAAAVPASVHDVFRYTRRGDPDLRDLVLLHEESVVPAGGVRVFHINGDEVGSVLEAFAQSSDFAAGYNIIVPAWELPRYPDIWKPQLQRFDEVWAISHFVRSSIAAAGLAVHHVGQSVEADFGNHLPRRFFDIRESAFALLSQCDTASYISRKNPFAVIELFTRFRKLRPFDDVQLVLKLRAGDCDLQEDFIRPADLPRGTALLRENYSSYAARSLIECCDCLLSLHRSEGFGRGMGEAMISGRLALATGWSGNCDYMTEENSLLVRYTLIDVKEGEYPHAAGQQWAEPDIDHALHLLLKALDDPSWARQIRRRGRLDASRTISNRSVGLRMLARLRNACTERGLALP
ncbi:MAG: glycosyltransferase [Acidisphaera sp.]|nr:glycosyltransferase [Acidisphaera sp.]